MDKLTTQLKDRKLRFDGTSIIHPDNLTKFLLLGIPPGKLLVDEISDEIDKFNSQVKEEDYINLSNQQQLSMHMNYLLPDEYKQLDLLDYFCERFEIKSPKYSPDQVELAIQRIADELEEVSVRNMTEFMQTVIYILDTFRKEKVIWGVGRGSSCASYLLYLAGLHLIDCIELDIHQSEFFHE